MPNIAFQQKSEVHKIRIWQKYGGKASEALKPYNQYRYDSVVAGFSAFGNLNLRGQVFEELFALSRLPIAGVT